MTKQSFLKSLATVISLVPSLTFAQCPDAANIYPFSYNNREYELVKEQKIWVDAAACAVARGGYLVHIDSLSEQNAIYDAILSSGISPTYTTVADGGGIAYIWIGATDKNEEGTWIWDGNNDNLGTHFWTGQGQAGNGIGAVIENRYVNWGGTSRSAQKEPDDYLSNQDAAAIALAGWPKSNSSLGLAREWNDIKITNSLYYIVEYGSITGFKDTDLEESNFSLSPNPCKDFLGVTGKDQIKEIKIIDVLGEMVYSREFSIKTFYTYIELSHLKTGLYYLSVVGENQKKKVLKFLKE